jgi:intracellular multiplication protein IcmJ
MGYHGLTFNFDVNAWRLYSLRRLDPAFQAIQKKIFGRDRYECQFCGFISRVSQEVVNLNHNYKDNRMPNLVTACPFCVQSIFLHQVGKLEVGGGVMIACKQLSQNEINGLAHVLFCAIANGTDYMAGAQEIYNQLRLLSSPVEKNLGKNMTDPAHLATMVIDTPIGSREQIIKFVRENLRLLPSRSGFKASMKTWAQAALRDVASS